MFAHVVTFQGPAEQLEGIGMRGFRERVVPVLRQQEGFQGALVMLDRAQNQVLGVTLWDTDEHARAAGTRLEQERQTGVTEIGATSSTAAIYEVLAQL